MNLRNFGGMRIDRLGGVLERRQGVVLTVFPVVPVGRSVTVTILFIVEFGVTVGVPIVVDVDVGADDLRERNGHASGHIDLSVDFRDSTEVKNESGDCCAK